ncbi:hypothetical protein Vafri_7192 [Volvox africanus]|uniref:Peroxin-13 n=1 Tax=Volvox africanus TaxID=51714 RepID=A0A8J4F096_9CHLO|nr:hypothetical protein Vafri_7192 [Volvox africanus]
MSGAPPPPKPWEAAKATATTTQGAGPKPWEAPQAAQVASDSTAIIPRTQPSRPWEREGETTNALATTSSLTPGYSSSRYSSGPGAYGGSLGLGYGSSMYGSSTYGSGYRQGYGMGSMYGGGYGAYGSGMYGSTGNMYGGYGSYGLAGGMYGQGGMYGAGGMYGSGGMYGGGAGMYGPPGMPLPGGPMDPNHPPPNPPTAWQSFMHMINGVMHFFGRLSFLVDENTHAVHFFISALLQLLDRAGSLYAEVARFVLRLLFRKRASMLAAKKAAAAGGPGAAGAGVSGASHHAAVPGGPEPFGAAAAATFGGTAPPAPVTSGTVGAFLGGPQAFGLGPGGPMRTAGMAGAGGPQWDNLWNR